MEENVFIKLEHISKTFPGVKALDNIRLTNKPGAVQALVGENGAGKATLIKVLAGNYKPDEGGRIMIDGETFDSLTPRLSLHKGIVVIYQDFSLFPNLSVAENISITEEMEKKGVCVNWNEMRTIAQKALERLGVDIDVNVQLGTLSTAKQQLVAIARALACDAKLIIMDEPTTALELTIQAQILDLIRDLNQEMNTSVVFITHDLGVVSELCDTVIVMYNGHIVEKAPTTDIFREPLHPYTQGLLSAIPRITKERKPLSTIEGMVPNPVERIKGCRFWPRCPKACDRCRKEEPPVFSVGEDRQVRCWLYAQADNGSQEAVTNG
mgnify:CR=1 FL=1